MAHNPEDSYYNKNLMVKITEKQRQMLGIMVDILDENRSHIVRRLLMVEAKKVAAELEGEELGLWLDLINQIEKEEDYHEFVWAEAIERGRRDAYFERTGIEIDDYKARKLNNDAIAQRKWHKRKRLEKRMKALKELDERYGIERVSN